MKTKAKIFLVVLFSICMILLFNGKVSADYTGDTGSYDQNKHRGQIITKNNTNYYYEDWKQAVAEAQDGDTVKFVAYNSNISSLSSSIVIENKNITINWNRKNITAKFEIKNCTVNFESTPNQINSAPLITVSDNGTVVIDGNSMDGKDYWSTNGRTLIQVGTEDTTGHLIIKNVKSGDGGSLTQCIRGRRVAEVLGPNSSVEVINSRLTSDYETIVVKGTDNVITIKESVLNQASHAGFINCDESSKGAKINISNTSISNGEPIELRGQDNKLTLDNVDINLTREWGLGVFGTNNTVTIKNSTVAGAIGGIYADSSTSSVIIDNSTIKGVGDSYSPQAIAPGIYSKNIGSMEIKNNSKVEGLLGIVAEGGNITVDSGSVTGSYEPKEQTAIYDFDGRKQIKTIEDNNKGVAVLVDNTSEDESKAKVTINGGTFNATAEKSLVSAGDTNTDFSVSSGTFNKPFKKEFVVPGKLELHVAKGEDQKWYVGQVAQDVYKEIENNDEYAVEIIQGEIEREPEQQETPDNNTVPDDNTSVDNQGQQESDNNEKNPNTADNIVIFIALLVISAVGIGSAVYLKRKNINK